VNVFNIDEWEEEVKGEEGIVISSVTQMGWEGNDGELVLRATRVKETRKGVQD